MLVRLGVGVGVEVARGDGVRVGGAAAVALAAAVRLTVGVGVPGSLPCCEQAVAVSIMASTAPTVAQPFARLTPLTSQTPRTLPMAVPTLLDWFRFHRTTGWKLLMNYTSVLPG